MKDVVAIRSIGNGGIMYYSDKPITTSNEDSLNREYFAKLIAKAILNVPNKDTFTIGLYGKWGNGKTSIVNMMLEEIEKIQKEQESLLIIHFEPWNFSNTDQLLEQFFVRLTNVFHNSKDEKMKKIGDALEKYSDAFEIVKPIPYVGEILSLLGENGTKLLGKKLKKGNDEKDILKQKENVIDLLGKEEKRVLIVIDDIDRLSNEKIRQVFQLITSVAKFPNTTYLLVFDKEIVVKALEKVQEGSGEEYLEKIIQMPIQIPNIHKNEFRQVLLGRLDAIIKSFEGVMLEETHWANMFETCVEPMIKNLRDINRLCNVIQFKLSALVSEVEFSDMLVISLIEIVYPSIYKWIMENKEILTGKNDLSVILQKNKSQEEQYKFYLSEISKVLEKDKKKYEQKECEKIQNIICQLFPYFGQKVGKITEMYNLDLLRKNNRISHPEKFERYFNLNIEYIGVRTAEIVYAIQRMTKEELISFILRLDKNKLSYEFLQEIKASIQTIESDRAKIIIDALFECVSDLDMVTNKSLLAVSSSSYAIHLVLPLFEKIDKEERLAFWKKKIYGANLKSLPTIAQVINMLELGYGRLIANGEEKDYKKVISLNELLVLEKEFSKKTKNLLDKYSIFDFADYRMIMYLMENFEPGYIEGYMNLELQSDINVLKYLKSTIYTWTGNSVRYEISNEYERHLTKERIVEAIRKECDTKEIFDLPQDNQRLCAAFYLKQKGVVDDEGQVVQKDADDLLEKWKEK